MVILKFLFYLFTTYIIIIILTKYFARGKNKQNPMYSEPVTVYHPVIGYTFCKNIKVSIPCERGFYIVKTNSDGIRSNKEYAFKKENPDCYRILVFGDSFTAADAVNNSERFTDLLESKLKSVEIINFGVSGYGTDQQLLMFKEKGLNYEFDLVIVCPLIENIRRNVAHYRLAIDRLSGNKILVAKPYFMIEDDKLILCDVPVSQECPLFEKATKNMLSTTDLGGLQKTYLFRDFLNKYFFWLKPILITTIKWKSHLEYYNPQSHEWILMARLLKEFKNLTGDKPVVICPLPYYIQIEDLEDSQPYLERFKYLNNEAGMHVVDIFKGFRQLDKVKKRQCRYKHDIHYTPFAHKIVAEALYAELKTLNIIPAFHF